MLACNEIAKNRAVAYISGTHNTTDLLHRVQVRAETTVHGEDLLVDNSGNGQTVEAVGKGLPELNVVATLALVVEAVDAVDGGALVVAAEDEEVLGVLNLVGEEKADGLEGLLATVDVVAEEEVVGLGRETTVLEETEEIIVLAVDITADLSMLADGLRGSWHRELTLMGASSSRRMG